LLYDELIFVEDGEKAVREYVQSHFKLLLPFIIYKGISDGQIRISEKQYKTLSERIKGDLKFHAVTAENIRHFKQGTKAEERWLKENYWTPCKAYIFDYKLKRSFTLKARCEWGYEGVEESYTIIFLDTSEYPEIINRNLETNEGKEDFNPNYKTSNW